MSKRVWVVPGYVLDRPVDMSADVWAARIAGSIDQVALRIIPLVGEDAVEAGRRAALALTALDHPHLLALHEVITLRDAVVVVSDLFSGGSLDGLLRARGRLAPAEVAAILAPIASALAYVHERGLIHGDVAPKNVLLSVDGASVLSKLGAARIAGADMPNPSTPAYIDPTVACGVFPSPTSDVFMLGAIAFHALTGGPVWPGDALDATNAAIAAPLDRSLDRVAERLAIAGVPAGLSAAVSAALTLDAHLRPSAAQLAATLAGIAPPPATTPLPLLPAIEPDLAAAGWAYELPSAPPPVAPVLEPVVPVRAEPLAPQPLVEPEPVRIEPFEPATHRGGRHSARRSRSPWLLAAIIAIVLAAGATTWALTSGTTSTTKPGAHSTSPPASLPTGGGFPFDPASGNITPSEFPPGGAIDAQAATQILNTIDSIRQRAFAARAPVLLTGVYANDRLLADDQALLKYLVPAGCGLQGVRTIYADVQVLDQSSVSVVVLTRTSVSSAVLVCHGKITGQSPESPPLTNRITLLMRGTGWVISEIAQLSTPSSTSTH